MVWSGLCRLCPRCDALPIVEADQRLPADRELAVPHLVALETAEEAHAEERDVEVFEHGGGNVVERELTDANLAKGHRRHARRAVGCAYPVSEGQFARRNTGRPRISKPQSDEAGAGVHQ